MPPPSNAEPSSIRLVPPFPPLGPTFARAAVTGGGRVRASRESRRGHGGRLAAIRQVLAPSSARVAFTGGSRGCARGQPRRRDGGKDAMIVGVLHFQARAVISHLPNSGHITAVACPAMNSTRCLSSSESTITCGFLDRLLPVSISRTVLSEK